MYHFFIYLMLSNRWEGNSKATSFINYTCTAHFLVVYSWKMMITEPMGSLVRKHHAAANNVAEGEAGITRLLTDIDHNTVLMERIFRRLKQTFLSCQESKLPHLLIKVKMQRKCLLIVLSLRLEKTEKN